MHGLFDQLPMGRAICDIHADTDGSTACGFDGLGGGRSGARHDVGAHHCGTGISEDLGT